MSIGKVQAMSLQMRYVRAGRHRRQPRCLCANPGMWHGVRAHQVAGALHIIPVPLRKYCLHGNCKSSPFDIAHTMTAMTLLRSRPLVYSHQEQSNSAVRLPSHQDHLSLAMSRACTTEEQQSDLMHPRTPQRCHAKTLSVTIVHGDARLHIAHLTILSAFSCTSLMSPTCASATKRLP
jgi:hypothetical protein